MKAGAINGLKQMVDSFRPQAESIGLGGAVRKLDAALLLEDEEKILKYANELLLQLREALAAQIKAIDEALKL